MATTGETDTEIIRNNQLTCLPLILIGRCGTCCRLPADRKRCGRSNTCSEAAFYSSYCIQESRQNGADRKKEKRYFLCDCSCYSHVLLCANVRLCLAEESRKTRRAKRSQWCQNVSCTGGGNSVWESFCEGISPRVTSY